MSINRIAITVVALLASSPGTALSGDEVSQNLSGRHVFLIGGALQEAEADLRATSQNLAERSLDLDDLGMDERYDSWYAEYRYKFGERWGLVMAGNTFRSEGDLKARSEFNFDGEVFPVGAQLDTELTINTLFVDVMYDVYSTEQTELSLGLGLHSFAFETDIRAQVQIGEQSVESRSVSEDLLAPLPNLRGHWLQALSERWTFGLTAGWMSANVDDWDGSFVYVHPRLYYRFGDHFGVALGYQYTDVDVSHQRKRVETQFEVQLRGPTLTLSYQL